MLVTVPKEIKTLEYRVGITPAGVKALVDDGHEVHVQKDAGTAIGITDADYVAAGAKMVATAKEAWAGDMVVKVKEPLEAEYGFFREGMVLYTYLHLAAEPALTKALIEKKVIGIAYETVTAGRTLPLLAPMSEVAGRMATQVAAEFIQKKYDGLGILLGGVAGTPASEFVVVGAGIVGIAAARMAIGLGARVTILDNNIDRLRYIDDIFGNKMQTLFSNSLNIAESVKKADVVIGSVLIPGAKTPQLITEEMVKTMKKGSVIVDVAIDQGGSVETCAQNGATYHDKPTFMKHDVIHYCVGNMPGAYARTSTYALTNSTMKYMLALAKKGWKKACQDDAGLAEGINTHDGKIYFKGVADAFGYEYNKLSDIL